MKYSRELEKAIKNAHSFGGKYLLEAPDIADTQVLALISIARSLENLMDYLHTDYSTGRKEEGE